MVFAESPLGLTGTAAYNVAMVTDFALRPFIGAILASLCLAGCGFTPVYGTMGGDGGDVPAQLAQVGVATIPERSGQVLRTMLQQRLAAAERPNSFPYALRINLDERLINLGLQPDAVTTRTQVRVIARYRLVDRKTGQPVFDARARTTTSFNILESEYATDVSAQSARERALRAISEEIVQQLALYFRRRA